MSKAIEGDPHHSYPESLPSSSESLPEAGIVFSESEKQQRELEAMEQRLSHFLEPKDEETKQRLQKSYQRFLKAVFAPNPWQETPFFVTSDASFTVAQHTIYTILLTAAQEDAETSSFQQNYAPEAKRIKKQPPRRISLLIDSFGLLDGISIPFKTLAPMYQVNISRIGGLRQKTLRQLGEAPAFRNFAQKSLQEFQENK